MNTQTENYRYSIGFEFGNYQAKETLIVKNVPANLNIDKLSVLVLAYKGVYVTLKQYKKGEDLADESMIINSFDYEKLTLEASKLDELRYIFNIDTIYYDTLVENKK